MLKQHLTGSQTYKSCIKGSGKIKLKGSKKTTTADEQSQARRGDASRLGDAQAIAIVSRKRLPSRVSVSV